MTSVQANRVGTVGNRHSDTVVHQDKAVFHRWIYKHSLKDLFELRFITSDEMESDPVLLKYCTFDKNPSKPPFKFI